MSFIYYTCREPLVYHFCFLSYHVFFLLVSFIFALSCLHYHTLFASMNEEDLGDHGAFSLSLSFSLSVSV
jgi:hypothetical protein